MKVKELVEQLNQDDDVIMSSDRDMIEGVAELDNTVMNKYIDGKRITVIVVFHKD